MTGIQIQEIHKALGAAYNKNSLRQMLRFRLDRDLDDIVGDGPLSTMLFDLLLRAEEEGWEADLVKEAQRHIPGNVELAKVYEKYGFAPEISLKDKGLTQPAADAKVSSGGLEKLIRKGNPTFDMAVWRSRLSEVEVRICRIDINNGAQGTGILVGPDLVLTNHHVVASIVAGNKPVSSLSCLFDFKVLADGTTLDGTRVPVAAILASAPPTNGEQKGQPEMSLPTPEELDFALLQLGTALGSAPAAGPESPIRGWEKLPENPVSLTIDQGLIIAQHPAGEAMKLSVDTAGVISVNQNSSRVRYRNNTEGGSSGSPVFDMLWNLVALHHMGDPAQNHDPEYNQGVIPLSAIRAKIIESGHELI